MIRLNNKGTPYTSIEVHGISSQITKTFDAIIDTGFDGFIKIPLLQGLPLGLVTYSVGKNVLADGSQANVLLCHGNVLFETKPVRGIISLGEGDDVLVGTELLKKINASLTLDYSNNTCTLI